MPHSNILAHNIPQMFSTRMAVETLTSWSSSRGWAPLAAMWTTLRNWGEMSYWGLVKTHCPTCPRFTATPWKFRLGDNCQILAVISDICKIGQLSDRKTVSADNCQIRQLSDRTTVRSDSCQIGQLSDRTTVSGTTVSGPWTTVRKNCQCSEKTVRSYSCPLTNCKILQLSPTKLSVQNPNFVTEPMLRCCSITNLLIW